MLTRARTHTHTHTHTHTQIIHTHTHTHMLLSTQSHTTHTHTHKALKDLSEWKLGQFVLFFRFIIFKVKKRALSAEAALAPYQRVTHDWPQVLFDLN